MSSEQRDDDIDLTAPLEDHDPGPATLQGIVDDLLDAGTPVPQNPSYQVSSTDAEAITARIITDTASITVDDETAEQLDLRPTVAAYLPFDDHNSVTLNVDAHDTDRRSEAGSVVELTPEAARKVAIQLLASAAVADGE